MNDFITTHEEWISEYRKDKRAIWVRAELSSGTEVYFKDYKKWLKLKTICENDCLSVNRIKLQYRDHVVEVDTRDAEAVYVVRSILGEVGGIVKNYYTIGTLNDDVVYKSRWLTPELIEEEKIEEGLDNCFEEAIIYNHDKRKNEQEQI